MRRPRVAAPAFVLSFVGSCVLSTARPVALAGQDQASFTGVLTGRILGRFGEEVRVLPSAWIEGRWTGGGRAAQADSAGWYRLEGLPPGPIRLRAGHPGHEELTVLVRVAEERPTRVDLELTTRPLPLPGLDVAGTPTPIAAPDDRSPSTAPDPDFEVAALSFAPDLAATGLADAVRALPGNDPTDPTDVLFMRGSTADLKLVLLDGVPVYTPFHVAGLIQSFEPTLLGSARLHMGGAPARYDGGLTHILDLRTRPARRDRTRGWGSLDLLAATAGFETPLGPKAGLVASVRSLHDGTLSPLTGPRPYGYRDAMASFDLEARTGHRTRASMLWNEESVLLDFDLLPTDAGWGNRVLSVGHTASLGAVQLDVGVGTSRYSAELPLQGAGTPEDPTPEPILASARTERRRAHAEARWGPPGAPNLIGLSWESLDNRYAARGVSAGTGSGGHGRSALLGGFLEAVRTLHPEISIRAGMRADFFPGVGLRWAPRATVFWSVGPDALVTVAGGRYHQPTRTPGYVPDETLAAWVGDDVDQVTLPVATSDHVLVSLDQILSGSVTLGVQGFYKRFEGLGVAGRASTRNSGLDLRVSALRGSGRAWLGYGLSWFWSPVDLSGTTTDFAGRHLLSAGLSRSLLDRFHGEVRIAYGAGLPSTSIPFRSMSSEALSDPSSIDSDPPPAPLAGGIDQEFLRIDLEVDARMEFDRMGRSWSVRPYIRLLNALNRRDAIFYAYQPWRPESVTPLAERPILPVLGVAVRF